MKRILILGSTGSIGISTLSVIKQNPTHFKVVGLSTNSNIDLLCQQIKEFHPLFVWVKDVSCASTLKSKLKSTTRILSGDDGLVQMLSNTQIDKVVLAISGSVALIPLLEAIEAGKDIALANKEALVMAGPLIMDRADKKKVNIIPIDSEQSAIWQCLEEENRSQLKNIYLTASGGPFWKLSRKQFKHISLSQALRHPRWKMGKKITIDSATLMNKGLELLEAMYLFGIAPEKIKIIIHPESIIHSMVEYIDGTVIAQLSVTDMRIPIQYALSYPVRLPSSLPKIDFYKLKQLNFKPPDFHKFPCLEFAYRAAYNGGTMPCVLNAVNEVSVNEFLKKRLDFVSMPKVIEKVLHRHNNKKEPDLDDILQADAWAREEAYKIINHQ